MNTRYDADAKYRERILRRSRIRYSERRDVLNEYFRQYRAEHREQINAAKRAAYAAKRAAEKAAKHEQQQEHGEAVKSSLKEVKP